MFYILIREFLQDLKRQKLRTSLTLLAITWGTIAVVILLSFGEGIGLRLIEGMLAGGNRVMFVYGGQTSIPYEGLGIGRRIRLQEEDIALLQSSVPGIEYISPSYARWGVSVRSQDVSTNSLVEGVSSDYEIMRTMFPAAGGRFLNPKDIAQQRRVVFLGNKIAERLFVDENPVGKNLFIDGIPFTVVGIMKEKFQTSSMYGPDENRLVIPYTTFKTMYSVRHVNSILVRPANIEMQHVVTDELKRVLSAKYKFHPEDSQAISIWDFIEYERINRMIALGFQIFLFSVGFFTLLIAGVGVANIMYVVVKERTREIGIKIAVGAKKRDIIAQFVFESLFISLLGGGIGIAFSAMVVFLVRGLGLNDGAWQFFGHPILSSATLIATLSVLTVIGLLAGLFPARRAASVDPVESLRYE